jgi:hypothetical protein
MPALASKRAAKARRRSGCPLDAGRSSAERAPVGHDRTHGATLSSGQPSHLKANGDPSGLEPGLALGASPSWWGTTRAIGHTITQDQQPAHRSVSRNTRLPSRCIAPAGQASRQGAARQWRQSSARGRPAATASRSRDAGGRLSGWDKRHCRSQANSQAPQARQRGGAKVIGWANRTSIFSSQASI